jgi:hypothetical protein
VPGGDQELERLNRLESSGDGQQARRHGYTAEIQGMMQ